MPGELLAAQGAEFCLLIFLGALAGTYSSVSPAMRVLVPFFSCYRFAHAFGRQVGSVQRRARAGALKNDLC